MQPRLEALYAAIPERARAVADIGYDLGNLAVALLTRRPDLKVVGIEIQPQAKARFIATHGELVDTEGERLDLRTGDALRALAPSEVDGVVIAGIGALNIAAMLRAAPEIVAGLSWLVLCPPRFDGAVRAALYDLGLHPADEQLVRDRGHVYELIVARPGPEPSQDPIARVFGPRLFERRDPGLAAYLADVASRFASALDNDLASYGPDTRKAELGAKLRALPEALARARAFAGNGGY